MVCWRLPNWRNWERTGNNDKRMKWGWMGGGIDHEGVKIMSSSYQI